MKKYVFFISAITFVAVACNNDRNGKASAQAKAAADTLNYTTVQWLDSIKSFGSIVMGETIEIQFRCKNTGNKPLILTEVRPTCGCTVADYTKEPIAPGSEGIITAGFDSKKAGHAGEVRKSIMVSTNTKYKTEHYLIFTGDIKDSASNATVQPNSSTQPAATKKA
jgi:hypothetical protein